MDKNPVSFADLFTLLTNRHQLNTNVPVYITGNRGHDARINDLCAGFCETGRHQRVAIFSQG